MGGMAQVLSAVLVFGEPPDASKGGQATGVGLPRCFCLFLQSAAWKVQTTAWSIAIMKTAWMLATVLLATHASASPDQKTYTVAYIVTPSNVLVHALTDGANKNKKCDRINAESITPTLILKTGSHLSGWSFVSSKKTFGYVTWLSDRSGVHTTFIGNYILANCSLTETRIQQKSFDGVNRYADANAEYNRLILSIVDVKP